MSRITADVEDGHNPDTCASQSLRIRIPFGFLKGSRTVVTPTFASKTQQYICPQCSGDIILRKGAVRIAHFAHKAVERSCSGETLNHKCTKEWIAFNANNPEFSICHDCKDCQARVTLFRGKRSFRGLTEQAFGKQNGPSPLVREYRADVLVHDTLPNKKRVVAIIEVKHSHASSKAKLLHAHSVTVAGAFEVDSLDLSTPELPLSLSASQSTVTMCKICLRVRLGQRKTMALRKRQNATSAAYHKWKTMVDGVRTKRKVKFARKWLLLYKSKRAYRYALGSYRDIAALDIQNCKKCTLPVSLREWTTYLETGDRCNRYRSRDLYYSEFPAGYDKISGSGEADGYYHMECSPRCFECHDVVSTKHQWCACKKRTMRKCCECERWEPMVAMSSTNVPKTSQQRFGEVWICTRTGCARTCTSCADTIPRSQAEKYGGKCWPCNRRNYMERCGLDPNQGICSVCSKAVHPKYAICYQCHHTGD